MDLSSKQISDLLELDSQMSDDLTSQEVNVEVIIGDFTEEILALMKRKAITQADLAGQMGCSEPYVSKMLFGSSPRNFTAKSMAKIASALDANVRITVEARTQPLAVAPVGEASYVWRVGGHNYETKDLVYA